MRFFHFANHALDSHQGTTNDAQQIIEHLGTFAMILVTCLIVYKVVRVVVLVVGVVVGVGVFWRKCSCSGFGRYDHDFVCVLSISCLVGLN